MKQNEYGMQAPSLKHLVFGSGLIGSYLAGAFIYKKLNCTLHARPRLKAKMANGVVLSDLNNHSIKIDQLAFTCENADVNENTESKNQFDVIWLTVKCTALTTIKPDLEVFLHKQSVIVCCQNGVESHRVIASLFPEHQVIRAMVPFNVVSERAGCFHRGSEGHFTLEAFQNKLIDTHQIAAIINSEILPTSTTDDITALQWAKLQLNLGNAVNALADIPVKAMLENKTYRLLIAKAMEELLSVTQAKEIRLPKVANIPNEKIPMVLKLPTWLFKIVAQKMLKIDPKVRTSMWWDLKAGKQTEIDYLHQKVVEQANILSIPCAVNQWLVAQIKTVEQSNKELSFESVSFEEKSRRFLKELINIKNGARQM